jgi:hypothetical protein
MFSRMHVPWRTHLLTSSHLYLRLLYDTPILPPTVLHVQGGNKVQCEVTRINAYQIMRYLDAYGLVSDDLAADDVHSVHAALEAAEKDWATLQAQQSAHDNSNKDNINNGGGGGASVEGEDEAYDAVRAQFAEVAKQVQRSVPSGMLCP